MDEIFDNNNEMNLDYKDRNIYLSNDDFLNYNENQISPHIVQGSYLSYRNYLNTLFNLEYEDCYRGLKKDISNLQSRKQSINLMSDEELYSLEKEYPNLYFYLDGKIVEIYIDRNGIILKMIFSSINYRKLNSKRMKYGSLVILTDNFYDNFIFTTVFSNDLIPVEFPYYIVLLSLLNPNHDDILFLIENRNNLQIYESKAYFESYIHVLKRFQEINENNLPFEQELVFGKFNSINNYKIKLNQSFSLDNSQYDAINKSLSNNISLIQGPPGTGKTYVGIMIVRILLELEPDSQILIVSYTNHALDSFLEEIIKYTQSVVRIGGRCNNEKIQDFILDTSEKYYEEGYKSYLNHLDEEGENLENLINNKIIDSDFLDVQEVKDNFKDLFYKIVDDFFDLANEDQDDIYINHNEIYKLWNLIDIIDDDEFQNKLQNLLEKDNIDYLFDNIYNNLGLYFNDNTMLLNRIYNKYSFLIHILNYFYLFLLCFLCYLYYYFFSPLF